MTILFPVAIFSVISIATCIDSLAQPSKPKKASNDTWHCRFAALPFRLLPIMLIFAGAEILTGRCIYAAVLTVVAVSLLVWGSNLKRDLLGEPLLFSDAAVIKACFQHPRFYVNALALPARIAVLFGIFVICFAVISLLAFDLCHLSSVNRSALLERGLGVALASASLYLLMAVARTRLPARLMPRLIVTR
ncbi:hypothetical protein [Asaia prunellae]|uniref:hypothetical protein n=1 Tax=Asaia prunellae TaxID=610245 RepID=UPI000470EA37|nr:hypothetical protein [Asaia prunellae]